MQTDAIQSHLDFYSPRCTANNLTSLFFSPELIKIFYIARVIISDSSSHRVKSEIAPLISRENIFESAKDDAVKKTAVLQKKRFDNFVNIERITSFGDIARLLPREHLIYSDTVFYKKLANRELIKIDYEGFSGDATSVDQFIKSEETALQRSQKIYLLFDNSTSMNGEEFKKLFISKAIAIEYLRRVADENPQIYFRTFHSDVGELVTANTRQEIYNLTDTVVRITTGGGRLTRIGDAVMQAIADITSDPELQEAEILVITDGFGPIPKDLKQKLGKIKLHVILIPDLDIEKILKLYPDMAAWKKGEKDGMRPMPDFWKYYSSTPPPKDIDSDDLFKDNRLSYETASKSVKELRVLELLQGLNQIYQLQAVCQNFIFVVITSLIEESFEISLKDVETVEGFVEELRLKIKEPMSNEEKLKFLQTLNFLLNFLQTALVNSPEKTVRNKIKQIISTLQYLQSCLLEDPWLRSVLKADDIKMEIKLSTAMKQARGEDMRLFEALQYLIKILWQNLCFYFSRLGKQKI